MKSKIAREWFVDGWLRFAGLVFIVTEETILVPLFLPVGSGRWRWMELAGHALVFAGIAWTLWSLWRAAIRHLEMRFIVILLLCYALVAALGFVRQGVSAWGVFPWLVVAAGIAGSFGGALVVYLRAWMAARGDRDYEL